MKTYRRTFLKAGVAAGSLVFPRFSIGRSGPSANSRLNIAMIGSGGIAHRAFSACESMSQNVVAMCDVDSDRFPKGYEATQTFSDFRVMLDRMGREIDGVCVNTPDHTHFIATIDAMQRGMHVCTQKPLTHNIWEGRTLRKAKEKYGVVTCMGNQGHTGDGIRTMREWYEADVFGQVKEIHLGHSGPEWGGRFFQRPHSMPPAKQSVPANLDWDLWLGPARFSEYNEIFHPLSWRSFFEYGTGQFGDWFCHTGDGPVWILDLYEPSVVECVERGPMIEGMAPDFSVVRFDFPARRKKAACSMYWYDGTGNGGSQIKRPDDWDMGELQGGSYWFGENQNGYLSNRSGSPRLSSLAAFKDFRSSVKIDNVYPRIKGGPHAEWMRAIKDEGPEPSSNFDYAARMTEVALLGVLAQRFGGRIEWDAKNMRVTNRPELNTYLKEPVRRGWEYGEELWKR